MKMTITRTDIPRIIQDATGRQRNIQTEGQWKKSFGLYVWIKSPVAQLKIKRR